MADEKLITPISNQSVGIIASSLPKTFTPAYNQYVLSQDSDLKSIVEKVNYVGQGAYDAQVKNDEQDIILEDHELRIASAEETIANHEERITEAEEKLEDHEIRIAALEYAVTRKKSEVIYTGLSLNIPTTPTNLVSLIKTLTPSSGTLAPFFDTVNNKMVVYNENKTLNFKLSLIGSYPGGTTNRSMQLTFSGSVPDTLVDSRNAATATNNILLATFFSVDKNGFLATNGSTLTIQANGAAFTATTIKIIAEQ